MKNKTYTKSQIVESISRWTNYMIDNNMMTESEAKELLGEGLFKRAVSAVKRGVEKTKKAAKDAADATKTAIHDTFKPNDGVKKMLVAINSLAKDKVKLDGVKLYATLGSDVLPVKGFSLTNGKRSLLLLVDTTDKSAKPKTLVDLRKFIVDDNKIKDVKATIDNISCADVSTMVSESIEQVDESKLTDFIQKALTEPEMLKKIKTEVYGGKKGDDYVKGQIEKAFSKNSSGANDTNSSEDVTPTKKGKATKKSSSDEDASSKDAGSASKESDKPTKSNDNAMKVLDNKLIDVKAEKDNLGFVFSKSKAEIELDKKYADAFSL